MVEAVGFAIGVRRRRGGCAAVTTADGEGGRRVGLGARDPEVMIARGARSQVGRGRKFGEGRKVSDEHGWLVSVGGDGLGERRVRLASWWVRRQPGNKDDVISISQRSR